MGIDKSYGISSTSVLARAPGVQGSAASTPHSVEQYLCNRRSGKSCGAGLYLYQEAYETPGVSCLYIALPRDSAKKIMWKDVLKPINRKLGLGAHFNETELTATLPSEQREMGDEDARDGEVAHQPAQGAHGERIEGKEVPGTRLRPGLGPDPRARREQLPGRPSF